MLSSLLQEKISNEKLTLRKAAERIGTSHTTLLRALRGERMDLGTVLLYSAWLDVRPTVLLNSMSSADHSLADQVSVVLAGSPKLAKAFQDAMKLVSSGVAGPDLIKDIAAYAAYRINLADPHAKREADL